MSEPRQRRRFGSAVWILTAIILVLLIAVTAANHHAIAPLFLLLPVFLFANVEVKNRPLRVVDDELRHALHPERPSLFQRPPPLCA